MRLVTMPMSFLREERWPGVAVDMAGINFRFWIFDFRFPAIRPARAEAKPDRKSEIENRK
jgi:hypothetical protein